jgi:hypothetical protein
MGAKLPNERVEGSLVGIQFAFDGRPVGLDELEIGLEGFWMRDVVFMIRLDII